MAATERRRVIRMNAQLELDLGAHRLIADKLVEGVKDGTGADRWMALTHHMRELASAKGDVRQVSRADRLLGRFLETMANSNPTHLRESLVRLAAYSLAWAEALENEHKVVIG